MNFVARSPLPPLSNFIERFWYYDSLDLPHTRERVFPDGGFELIINLEDRPRKLFDNTDWTRFELFHRGWISGAHSQYLVIDVLRGSTMIGAHFHPAGAIPFLGMPADELQSKVVDLEAIWGKAAWELRDQLLEAKTPVRKLMLLEAELSLRLMHFDMKRANPRKARVAWAISQLKDNSTPRILKGLCRELGISQKHFICEFRQEVGLSPKKFYRIRRFQNVLQQIGAQKDVDWAGVAFDCGYYDQAHFIKDFRAFSGFSPSDYLENRIDYPNFARAD